MQSVAEKEVYLAEDTAVAELVLILKIRTRAPLENEHLYIVLACVEIGGNIYLAGHMADLTVCGELVVYKEIEAGVNALKVDENRLLGENVAGHCEVSAVKAAGVVLGNVWRVYGERVVDIRVVWSVVSLPPLCLPAHRNGHHVKAVGRKAV